MLSFFNTKERLRFLLYVGAIAVPLLLIASWVVSTMEDRAAAEGEANSYGGLHYRIQEKNGATSLPPPLAALLRVPPGTAMTDVNVDTDGSGHVVSAVVVAFSHDDFKTMAAFHKPMLSPVTNETDSELWGVRDGYEIKIGQEKPGSNDPYQDRTKVEYYVNPAKP